MTGGPCVGVAVGGDLMGIPPSGRPIKIRVCTVVELRDGKAYREYMDMATIRRLSFRTIPELDAPRK